MELSTKNMTLATECIFLTSLMSFFCLISLTITMTITAWITIKAKQTGSTNWYRLESVARNSLNTRYLRTELAERYICGCLSLWMSSGSKGEMGGWCSKIFAGILSAWAGSKNRCASFSSHGGGSAKPRNWLTWNPVIRDLFSRRYHGDWICSMAYYRIEFFIIFYFQHLINVLFWFFFSFL